MNNVLRSALLLGALFVLPTSAWAETIRIGSLPIRRTAAPYTLTTSMESFGGNGYHPFHFEFDPRGKVFNRDHYVEVLVRPTRTYGSNLNFTYRQSIKLDEGSGTQTFVGYVPNYFPWDTLTVSLLEEGEPVESGSEHYGLSMNQQSLKQKVTVGVIVRDRKTAATAAWDVVPDVRTLVTVLGDGPITEQTGVKRLSDSKSRSNLNRVQPAWVQFRAIPEKNSYTNWIAYSQLDVILVAAPMLKRIRVNQEPQYSALRQWVAAGGNLWVYAADAEPDPLGESLAFGSVDPADLVKKPEVRQSMNLSGINDTSELTSEYWNGVQKMSQNVARNSYRKRREIFDEMTGNKHPFIETDSVKAVGEKLQIAELGLGTVILIDDTDPFPGSFQLWQSIKQICEERLNWETRYGVDIPSGDDIYWAWLIPSVGEPPVKSFVMLNVLFAILIGPLCYFFFRRRQRLYLLYFAAPMLALLVSGSLFVYAIGSDGLTTKVRSRQLTWADPVSGVSVRQSRETYYSVMSRDEGLEQSQDTVMCPVHCTPLVHDYYHQSSNFRPGEVIIPDAETRRMTGNFLPPRDQVQYLTTQPIESKQTVSFQVTDGVGTITNMLDHPISQIVLRDKQGRYWQADNIAQDQSQKTNSAKQAIVNELLLPRVLPPLSEVPMLQANTRYSRNYTTGTNYSLLEDRLESWTTTKMPKGAFVATVSLDEKALGVDSPTVLSSTHVVLGYYSDGVAQ